MNDYKTINAVNEETKHEEFINVTLIDDGQVY